MAQLSGPSTAVLADGQTLVSARPWTPTIANADRVLASPAHHYASQFLGFRGKSPTTEELSQVFVPDQAQRWLRVAGALGIEFAWCRDCDRPMHANDAYDIPGERHVCDDCVANYSFCSHCDERELDEDMCSAYGGDQLVCSGCLDYNYHHCDTCGYYVEDDDEDHEHDDPCHCEAPHQLFSMPNNGYGSFASDERITVATAKGQIDSRGMASLTDYVWNNILVPLVDAGHGSSITFEKARDAHMDVRAMHPEWQTKDGNFTRRLARLLYRDHAIKVPPGHLSQLGNIARQHSSEAVEYHIELTRDLNMDPSAFYHEDSCWWGSYGRSRCALKQCGGMAIRSFDHCGDVSGRAWIAPLCHNTDGGSSRRTKRRRRPTSSSTGTATCPDTRRLGCSRT